MTTTSPPGRTQGERSAAMRVRLLDAAVDALQEKGYTGTTTLEVQQRAGVSRGALLHHYASRSDLILAAVAHLTGQRISALVAFAQSEAPASGRVEWAVRVLWSTFEGPLFSASLELWLAARADAELLAALRTQERALGHSIRAMAGELFGEPAREHGGFAPALELLLDVMRGAAARSVLRSTPAHERLVARWAAFMSDCLEDPGALAAPTSVL